MRPGPAWLAWTLGVGACSGTNASPCAKYEGVAPDAYGLCVKRAVVGVTGVAEMEALCARAGRWEGDCHADWVAEQARRGGLLPEVLLEACGPSADCSLQQLDAHPDPDVLVQLGRCQSRAGPYVEDCAAHAIQRWARAYPDGAEVDRVVAATDHYAVQVGTFVGMVVACGPGPGASSGGWRGAPPECPPGDGLYAVACHHGAEGFGRHPESCGGVLPPETVAPEGG